MEKTRKINKKKLKEISTIFILILITVLLLVSIRKTLSRYQSDAKSELNDFDVAFYITGDDYQSKNILISNIYPSDEVETFDFSIQNYEVYEEVVNGVSTNTTTNRISEVNTEFDIEIKATTNMPITYTLYYGEEEIGTKSIVLEDGVYIQKITANSSDYSDILFMEYGTSVLKTFSLKVNFPKEITSANNGNIVQNSVISDELSDLIDNVNISVTSRQKIN